MEELINILHAENCSLVIEKEGDFCFFYGRGVSDLIHLYKDGKKVLNGSNVADKLIGKGAAAIMIMGEVNDIYCDVITETAIELFDKYGKKVTYKNRVATLENCPIERICKGLERVEECVERIEKFFDGRR